MPEKIIRSALGFPMIKGEGMPIVYDDGTEPSEYKKPSRWSLFWTEWLRFYSHVCENVFDIQLGLGYSFWGAIWWKIRRKYNG